MAFPGGFPTAQHLRVVDLLMQWAALPECVSREKQAEVESSFLIWPRKLVASVGYKQVSEVGRL